MIDSPDILDPLEEAPSRYVVGIDLGTTNSAVCYVDTTAKRWSLKTFPVAQVVAPGQIEPRETLPSFHYQVAEGETSKDALKLPWSGKKGPKYAVGVYARTQGAAAPGRLIASAKSWLCHTGVDRTADLLPWQGAADVDRLSPVEVCSRYLKHIHDAWNAQFRDEPLDRQDIVLTLPASFDEIARELTIEAASRARLSRVVLIEEPQAAFYSWLHTHAEDWESRVTPGQKILVCDIGGGTSDFTLIRVRRGEQDKVQFHRVAVGEHLILGGDNLDLALAHHLEGRIAAGGKLSPRQWAELVNRCRQVKETLLGGDAPEKLTVSVSGGGSRLIGGAKQAEITRDEALQVLLDGFLPRVDLNDNPQRRQSGFQEFGLPFASDPAITRHLAAFLRVHRHAGDSQEENEGQSSTDPARPDIVLFNGGLFESSALRGRLLEVLSSWFQQDDSDWRPLILKNERLDLAVARGAAYYGMVRRGEGVRIAAGLARTYYIGVDSDSPSAVCLAPAGAEPGQDIELSERTFELLVSQPVEFPLFVSSVRLTDRPGELVEIDREQMTALPPIRTVLRTRSRGERGAARVRLHAQLTEIGTLELWCKEIDGERSWRLQFDVRSATQTDIAAHESAAESQGFVDEAIWQSCRCLLHDTFGPEPQARPQKLMASLSEAIEASREQWPASLLRRIWDELLELEPGRRHSQAHEARWLNLLGFALRPGYGLAADDWRVAQTWRILQGKLVHSAAQCRTESWILWRRIGGGLTSGQQQAVAEPLLSPIRALRRNITKRRGMSDFPFGPHETAELWRLLGSLELQKVPGKIELGDALLDLMGHKKLAPSRGAMVWAVGRLGSRSPLYGPLNTVVPAEKAGEWAKRAMKHYDGDPNFHLAVMQLVRRTDDRYRDAPPDIRDEAAQWLAQENAPAHFVELVRQGGVLDEEETTSVFGESLPTGLKLT